MRSDTPIRPATAADIDEIVRITNRAYLAEVFCIKGLRTSVEDIRAKLDSGTFLVMDDPADRSRLQGSVLCVVNQRRGYLGMLTVDPDCQGKGLSASLIAAAEHYCREAGCNFLDLTVINVRENLFPFYLRFGFAACDVEPFPVPEKMLLPLHLVRMTKALRPPSALQLAVS